MNLFFFIKGIVLTLVVALGSYYLLIHFFPQFTYTQLNFMSLLLFTTIAFFVYYRAEKAAKSDNKYSFLNIVVMNLFMKIVASFIVVVIYVNMTNPTDKWYLICFTMNYLIFTIFETIFLSKAARVQ